MGLLDKVKAQAEQVAAKAQQQMAQGQAKLDAMQAHRVSDGLLRDLGAAYYAEQRQGAGHAAVDAALAAVDQHAATNGPIDLTRVAAGAPGAAGAAAAGGTAPTGAPTASAPSAPAGDYRLDDL